MGAIEKTDLVSVEDYLAGELASPIKHEYVGGVVYAMSGVRNAHALIARNILVGLTTRLRGKRCQPYASDTKIRLRFPTHLRFYYPDVSVTCSPNPQSDSYQDTPTVIFEVVSRGTRRIDEGEKKDAYLTIPSLELYALVEQEAPLLLIFRRSSDGFVRQVIRGLDAVLPLPEIGAELSLAEIYETVELVPEADVKQ